MLVLQLLLVVVVANGAPILLHSLCGDRLDWPLDGGLRLPDGRPVFGPSKTVRGVVGAVAASVAAAAVLDLGARIGLLIGVGAMVGDLLSSLTKRRLGIEPSGRALGLDQIPEAAVPMALIAGELQLSASDLLAVVVAFFASGLLLSRLLFRLNIRRRPY